MMTSPQFSPEASAAGAMQSEGPKAVNLKVKEALKVLNVSRTTLYEAWKGGWGPEFFWVGRSRRIPMEAALSWRGKPAGGEA